MSQTSLASAIRRRTKTEIVAKTTQGNIPIPPHKKMQQNSNNNNQNNNHYSSTISISETPVSSPLMLLLQHKQLINKLENEISELKESKNKNSSNPSEVEYYKKQYETLLNEFAEIKKVLVKVQTFSMETNLEMLQLKRLLKQNNVVLPTNHNSQDDVTLQSDDEAKIANIPHFTSNLNSQSEMIESTNSFLNNVNNDEENLENND
jgi:hypothetical protein